MVRLETGCRRRRRLAHWALFLALATAAPSAAQEAKPEPIADWRAAAERDVGGVYGILGENSPAMHVEKDSRWFREWREKGYRQALADLGKVTDAAGYFFLLKRYVNGFRDGHISFSTTPLWKPEKPLTAAWPGISTRWTGYSFAVSSVEPTRAAELPPVGAELIGCDGRSTETIARERLDLWETDLDHDYGRINYANRLVWDRSNPFVGPPPGLCRFRVSGRVRDYRLRYGPIAPADATAHAEKAYKTASPHFTVEPWGEHRWWIGLPSFSAREDWDAFFAKIAAYRPFLREAEILLFDVRGNGGGASRIVTRLAQEIWGAEVYAAYASDPGPATYRVSPLNRRQYDTDLAELEKAGTPSPHLPFFKSLVEKFDRAAAAGQPLIRQDNDFPKRTSGPPPLNPVKGRVVLLIDHACFSTCLDFVDRFRLLPNAVLIGTRTNADTIYSDVIATTLPSGAGRIGYGHVAFEERARGSLVPYTPSPRLTFRGDRSDERAWRSWLAERVRSGALR
jgi:hypothetical protein